jgi:alkanesulfonate monooxygenase SsuD/methylene tetrahydromethanopterin reductase-like flavin-dependent oxidoreductase (luciferase family)
MKLGLQLSIEYRGGDRSAWSGIRAQAEAAEQYGFDGVFIPTEIGWRRPDTLSLMAALASITRRVQIGSNIITLPLYAPVQVAEAIATIDQVSGGRVILGIAHGWRPEEFSAAGIPFSERVGRTYEPELTFKGRYYDLDHVSLEMKSVQQPHPPIWVGAHAQRSVERAARAGLVWIEGPRASIGKWEAKRKAYVQAVAGLDPVEFPLIRDAFVAASSAEARAATEGPLISKYREYAERARIELEPGEPLFDHLAPGRFIVGSVEECREHLLAYAEAGVTWLVLRLQYLGSNPAKCIDCIRLFGQEVRPALEAAGYASSR